MIKKYPSIFLLLAIISGVVISDCWQLPTWYYLMLVVVCGFGVVWFRKAEKRLLLIGLIFLAIMSTASFYYNFKYVNFSSTHITQIADSSQRYQIFGYLSDWPRIKYDRTEIKLTVDSLIYKNQTIQTEGAVMIKLSDTTTTLQRGDRLEFMAKIYPVISSHKSAGFDYQRFLNHKNIFGLVYLPTLLDVRVDNTNRYSIFALVDKLRVFIKTCFSKTLSENSAALAGGFLIGETRDIPVDLYQSFRQSGTLHLLAVSGSNVALVLLFVIILLRPLNLNRRNRSFVLLAVIFVFALLSYNEPSVLRASVMAALIIGGTLYGRRVDLNNIIAVAAVIILIAEPSQLYNVGFQLSFVIAWSLVFVLPKIVTLFDRYKNRRWYRWLVFPFLVALVAQLFSTGIIALYFGQVPVVSPLANLIVVPLVSLAVVGEMVLLTAYTILPALGGLVGNLLEVVFILIRKAVLFFGDDAIPAISFGRFPLWATLLYYLMLMAITFALINIKIRRVVVVAGLLCLNFILIYSVVNSFVISQNKLWLAQAPGGICAVIENGPAGQADLVVTSAQAKKYSLDEKIFLPLLKRNKIEKLNSVFCLRGDYQSYDDILRLAVKMKADTIYIWPEMAQGFYDVHDFLGFENKVAVIIAKKSKFQNETLSAGYYFSQTGLYFVGDEKSYFFTDYLKPAEKLVVSGSLNLVLGRLWNLDFDDLLVIAESGYDRIYCSKIAQTYKNKLSNPSKLSLETDKFIDLYEFQELTLSH